MSGLSKKNQRRIIRLLEDGSEIMGMKLCFRDRTMRAGLPRKWWFHVVPACMEKKREYRDTCANFAHEEADRMVIGNPEGCIRKCPFGFTELVIPVMADAYYAGPLFAGPCWISSKAPPHPSLVVVPSRKWLNRRRSILQAIAREIGAIMTGENIHRPERRRQTIMAYIDETIEGEVSIHELAELLNLSPSRTTHLVKELFTLNLPLLARERKLQEAARDLVLTDLPVGEIGRRYGYGDQNYFSRIFSEKFAIPPSRYRKRYPPEA